MEKQIEDSIVIIDEAHNAPERLRNGLSVQIDENTLLKAKQEAKLIGNEILAKQLAKFLCEFSKIEKELDEDERVGHKEELPIWGNEFLNDLYETGVSFLDTTNRHKSYCLRTLHFYENWLKDSEAFLRIIKKTNRGVKVQYKCLDPSVVTEERLNSTHSTILMSGTLKPGEMYRDLLGLKTERTTIKEYKSPFPKQNQLNIIMKNVTTKFEKRTEEEFEKIASAINDISNSTPGNVAVYFPSFKLMDEVKPFFEINKPVLIQEANQSHYSNNEMLSKFRKHSSNGGALLAGVTGGSFSEGIDFPGNQLLASIIVGIPLGEPDLETRALIRYYDLKFGKGWEYGYSFPAMSKAVQAAGRVIRDEKDRGIVAFLDNRFSWRKYAQCFPSYYDFTITDNPKQAVQKFWKEKS